MYFIQIYLRKMFLSFCVTHQISLVNNFLKLGLNQLKLCFRVRLTNQLYNDYLT